MPSPSLPLPALHCKVPWVFWILFLIAMGNGSKMWIPFVMVPDSFAQLDDPRSEMFCRLLKPSMGKH